MIENHYTKTAGMEENDMIIGDVFAGDLSNGEVNIYDDEYLVVFTVVAYRQPYS